MLNSYVIQCYHQYLFDRFKPLGLPTLVGPQLAIPVIVQSAFL